jgi:hypothetical protein
MGRRRRCTRGAPRIAALASAGLVALVPAVPAQSVSPDDFGAIAKVTKARQLSDDTSLFKQKIKSGGEPIGKANLKLTFGKRLLISATWRLDAGTIQARGELERRGDRSVAPIVDGTAAYRDAEGKVTFEELTPKRIRQEFDFR